MEPVIAESKELNQTPVKLLPVLVSDHDDVVTIYSGNDKMSLIVQVGQTFNLTKQSSMLIKRISSTLKF